MSKFSNKFLSVLKEDSTGLKKKVASKKNPAPSFEKDFNKKDEEKAEKVNKSKVFVKEVFTGVMNSTEAAPPTDDAPPADVTSAEPDDAEIWKRSLDKGTDPKDFDVADNPQLVVDASGVKAARGWIKRLESMAEFVNGTGPESLNSQINALEIKNSIPFRGVVRREEKRITKVAENLRGLAEVFKTVVITSHKKIKDATTR